MPDMMHLGKSESNRTWQICASYKRLYELAEPQFTAVYAEKSNKRHKCHGSFETLTAHWETLQSNVISWASRVLRDGFCHEACSR